MPVNDLQKKGRTLCPNSLMLNDLRKCRTFPVPIFPRPPLAHKKHFLTAYTLKDSCRVFFGWTSYVHVSWYNVLMTKKIRKGTIVRVGLRILCVDEICRITGNLFCLDSDGEDYEVRVRDVDCVNPWNWDSRDSRPD